MAARVADLYAARPIVAAVEGMVLAEIMGELRALRSDGGLNDVHELRALRIDDGPTEVGELRASSIDDGPTEVHEPRALRIDGDPTEVHEWCIARAIERGALHRGPP
jgi:hypothetical protein